MRIVHLSVVRNLTQGQQNQLKFEFEAAKNFTEIKWTTLAFHCYKPNQTFLKQIPWIFRPMFLRNLFGWLVVLTLSRNYDIVLMRHIVFDPFSFLFSRFTRNRISFHHAKEIEELLLIRSGWRGRVASQLERISGKFALKRVLGIVGVTGEIADYEVARSGMTKPRTSYPNGIDVESVEVLGDRRSNDDINIVFICGTFKPWHGLERLLNAVSRNTPGQSDNRYRIHLIGNINEKQKLAIDRDPICKRTFIVHGHMIEQQYRPILEICDIGLTSFALDLQGLREAATLKVREMLAMGLPVYSGHKDASLDDQFRYFFYDQEINICRMIRFSKTMKRLPRVLVRNCARPYIDKLQAMQDFVTFSRTLYK